MKILQVLYEFFTFLSLLGIGSSPRYIVMMLIISVLFVVGLLDFENNSKKAVMTSINLNTKYIAVNNVRVIRINNQVTGENEFALPLSFPYFVVIQQHKSNFSDDNVIDVNLIKREGKF